jgi:hypothetical protein
MTASEYGFVAPDDWGIRRSPGEIQAALIALVKAEADLQSSLGAYSSLIGDMEWLVQQLGARSTLNEKNLELHDELLDKTNNYNREMDIFQGLAKFFQSSAEFMGDMQDAVVESLPKIAGLSNDPTAPIRAGVKLKYAFASIVPRVSSIVFDSRVDYLESQLELLSSPA